MSIIFDALRKSDRPMAARAAATMDVTSALPGDGLKAASAKPLLQTPRKGPERRKQKRAGVKLAARVRSVDPRNGTFEEVLETANASRESFYFITASKHYHVGMHLRVTFPFNSAHDSVSASESQGEVRRAERLPDQRVGVAVQWRCSARMALSSLSRGPAEERRLNPRQPFSAAAVVVDLLDGTRLRARCSDLSLGGCYVDTLNPFLNGTTAKLRLHRDEKVFEAAVPVHSSHIGLGMGLGFQNPAPEQTSMLINWLTSGEGDHLLIQNSSGVTKRVESMDRAAATNLIRQIASESVLTRADVLALFSESVL